MELLAAVIIIVFSEFARGRGDPDPGMMRDVGRTGLEGTPSPFEFARDEVRKAGELPPTSLGVAVCGEILASELVAGERDWNASVSVGTTCAPAPRVRSGGSPFGATSLPVRVLFEGGMGNCIFAGNIGLSDGVGLGRSTRSFCSSFSVRLDLSFDLSLSFSGGLSPFFTIPVRRILLIYHI